MILGFGSGTEAYWNSTAYLVGALLVATAVMLIWLHVRWPDERGRMLRLGLFFGGMAALALGIGWARAAVYPAGIFASRYVTLAVPAFCAMYFAWMLVKRHHVAAFAQALLCLLAAIMVIRNRDDGYAEALTLHARFDALRADLAAGTPSHELARRHCGFLYLCGTEELAERMRMLRDLQRSELATLKE